MAKAPSAESRISVGGAGNEYALEEAARGSSTNEGGRVFALGVAFVLLMFAAMLLPTYMFKTTDRKSVV